MDVINLDGFNGIFYLSFQISVIVSITLINMQFFEYFVVHGDFSQGRSIECYL